MPMPELHTAPALSRFAAFLESGVRKVSGRCLEGVWNEPGQSLESVWRVSGGGL